MKSQNIIRILSKQGVCSRKQAAEFVLQGKVSVNGKTILSPGALFTIRDKIVLDGKPVEKAEKKYIIFNKPKGCVTTRNDEKGRKTVYDYLGDMGAWLFPVGRLDMDSEGLLIFTNDTAFGDKMTDPKNMISKTYEVLVAGIVSNDDLNKIKNGMDIGRGEMTGDIKVSVLNSGEKDILLKMVLTEGKNREIRRIFEKLDKKVLRLHRTDFGPFRLGSLKTGEWRDVVPNISSVS